MKKQVLLLLCLLLIPFIVYAEDGNLTIENIQDTSEIINYVYNIHIDGVSGDKEIMIDEVPNLIPFDVEGNTNITIRSNSKLVLNNLPLNASYSITIDPIPDYEVAINNASSSYNGIINQDTRLTVRINRLRNTLLEEEKDVKANPKTSDNIAIIG